jgi:hypothetical protein
MRSRGGMMYQRRPPMYWDKLSLMNSIVGVNYE